MHSPHRANESHRSGFLKVAKALEVAGGHCHVLPPGLRTLNLESRIRQPYGKEWVICEISHVRWHCASIKDKCDGGVKNSNSFIQIPIFKMFCSEFNLNQNHYIEELYQFLVVCYCFQLLILVHGNGSLAQ